MSRARLSAVLFAVASLPVFGANQETLVLPLSGMGAAGEAPVYWDFKLDSGRGSLPTPGNGPGFACLRAGSRKDSARTTTAPRGATNPMTIPSFPRSAATIAPSSRFRRQWRGQQVRIVFEAAMTDTTVRINGQPAGPTHQGGFYRFHYDISSLVKFGARNLLEVSVSKESANVSVNRAERRGDYWTFGGIYRPVWLEARPRDHIEWTAIDARADGSFYAQVHLETTAPANSRVRARIFDEQGNAVGSAVRRPFDTHGTPRSSPARSSTSHVDRRDAESVSRRSSRCSTPGRRRVHTVTERFGFRTFEVRPRDGLYLNGRKIVLKGINRHSFAPATGRTLTREQSYRGRAPHQGGEHECRAHVALPARQTFPRSGG